MKAIFSIIFLSAIGIVFCEPVRFARCDSPSGHINSVDVTPCHGLPCRFPAGADGTIKVNFTSAVDTEYINAVVHGYVLKIPVPFPLPEPLACKRGVNCPVKATETNVYETTLPVRKIYPRIKVGVKVELQDDQGRNVACFKVPVKIV